MYSRFHLIMVAAVLLLTVFIVVAFFTLQRETGFREHSNSTGRAALTASANEITSLVENLQDRVHVFAEEHQREVRHLASHSNDDAAFEAMKALLQRHFPHFFAFTITDSDGHPLLEDIESLVGDVCSKDLRHYSRLLVSRGGAYRNQPWIHPQPGNYHFDVMAHWQEPSGALNRGGVFFVSFLPDLVVEILRQNAIPGHQLVLVKEEDQSLIEVSQNGGRDQLRRDIRLLPAEQQRAELSRAVDGTAWRVLLLPDADLESNYQRGIWRDAIVIMALAAGVTVLLLGFASWHHRKIQL